MKHQMKTRRVLISKHMCVYIKITMTKAKISILLFIVINLGTTILIAFTLLCLIYSNIHITFQNGLRKNGAFLTVLQTTNYVLITSFCTQKQTNFARQ